MRLRANGGSLLERGLASNSPYTKIAILERFGSELKEDQKKRILGDPHPYVRKAAAIYLSLTPEQMNEKQSDPSWHVRKTPPRYLRQDEAQVERSLNDEHMAVRAFAVLKQDLTEAQMRRALSDKSKKVREAAQWKLLSDDEKFEHGISSNNWFIRVATIEMFKAKLTKGQAWDQLRCRNWYVRKTIASVDHLFDKEQIAAAIKDPHWRVREAVGWHQDLTMEQTNQMLDDPSPAIRALAYAKRKLGFEFVEKGLRDTNGRVREAVILFQSPTEEQIRGADVDRKVSSLKRERKH